MTNTELLKKVKDALSISGNYQDATLNVYIEEVKEYLKSAGLATETIQGIKCVGIICRGVTDLWAYGVGEGKLSSYFMQRVSQLVLDEKKVIADKPQEPGSDSGLTEEQLAKINTITFTVKNGKDGANGSGGSESVDLSNYYNKSEVDSKIDGLNLGDKNVQADWNTADKASDSYIRNKPTIPKAYDDTALAERVASLENSAFSGNYEDLQNKPTIPTKVSQLENDKDYLTQSDIETTSTHTHANKAVLDGITAEKVSEWNNKSNFDGDYNSLTNKPTIPNVEGLATETYVDNAVSSAPVYDDAEIKASVADLQTNKASKTDIADFQTQAQVESLVSSEIAKIVANAPSNFDTLKEIADWIATHENSASAMNTAITANTQAIANCVKKTDITISATDIGEGSTLADGALYFVYE